MTHAFMEQAARGLCDRGIATCATSFLYGKASRRPDAPALAQATVRPPCVRPRKIARACAVRRRQMFGGRMTSQAQAAAPLAGVRDLPSRLSLASGGQALGRAGKAPRRRPSPDALHQGTRDKLAELPLLEPVVKRLGPSATLHRVRKRSFLSRAGALGRKDGEVMGEIVDALSTGSARRRGEGRCTKPLWSAP